MESGSQDRGGGKSESEEEVSSAMYSPRDQGVI